LPAPTLLLEWLKSRLAPSASAWLEEKASLLASDAPDKTVFASFSACIRHSGKAPLALDAAALAAARSAVPGWDPSDWTCDQAARIFLLTALPAGPGSARLMDKIYHTADVGEAVAMQKALAVLEFPEGHMARAREAVRSNIQAVFEAVALRNPYPALHFDEIGWNQLVVKTLFVEAPVHAIVDLDRRANAPLARMFADLAHERRAAGRPFNPELWRCVGPLALASCPDPRAALLLRAQPALAEAIRDGRLTWENFNHGD
jgi:hypothetical protein